MTMDIATFMDHGQVGTTDRPKGDGPCADCGTENNIIWFTDNTFWNAVTAENVVHEESSGTILCVTCFVDRAHVAGYRPMRWRLLPEWPWF
jgi:hypothetical protein